MRSLPRVSVVMPSYNQGEYLTHAMDSVLSQGYGNLDFQVLDGGSTDGSAEKVESYAPRLSRHRSHRDAGQYATINEGFSNATGEVYAWLNSDDAYVSGCLPTVGSIFADLPEVEWLTTRVHLVFGSEGFLLFQNTLPFLSNESLQLGLHQFAGRLSVGTIMQEATFFRRHVWEEVGGLDLEVGLAADADLWLRMAKVARLHSVDFPLAMFRVHGDQRSNDHARYRDEATASFKRHGKRSPLLDMISRAPFHKVRAHLVGRLAHRLSGPTVRWDRQKGAWRVHGKDEPNPGL